MKSLVRHEAPSGPYLRVAQILVVLLSVWAPVAAAHHILGVPHYAYSEDYPQAPVLTYSADLGPNHLRMTGYPGRPVLDEACSLHVYISHIVSEKPFEGVVTLTVFQDGWFGPGTTIYGPSEAQIEEATYKFFPVFRKEANYTVRIQYEEEGVPWIIDLPIVAGEPGSPGRVLAVAGGSFLAFLTVVRAIRIKLARRDGREPSELSVLGAERSVGGRPADPLA